MKNRRFLLAERPKGLPTADTFAFDTETLADLGEDEVRVKVMYISLDPAMRGWMNAGRSYIRPVEIGEVMRAGGVGRVIASNSGKFSAGDYVTGSLGVQEYAQLPAKHLTPIDPNLAPLPQYLGPLGMTGMTAYFGLLDVGKPQQGETVLVSAAAGAVGSVVGQIAKIKGCRVVGIAGGPEKNRFVVEELGFDACIDYKNENVRGGIKKHCPDGVDIYFDNVGGSILDAALSMLARNARVVICGAISQYNSEQGMEGPRNYMSLLVNRASMEGFVVFDYSDRYLEAAREIGGWMMAGKIRSEVQEEKGLENFLDVLLKLFSGDKRGKLVLKVAEDEA